MDFITADTTNFTYTIAFGDTTYDSAGSAQFSLFITNEGTTKRYNCTGITAASDSVGPIIKFDMIPTTTLGMSFYKITFEDSVDLDTNAVELTTLATGTFRKITVSTTIATS